MRSVYSTFKRTLRLAVMAFMLVVAYRGAQAQEVAQPQPQHVPTGIEYLAAQGADDLMRERLRAADLINQVAAWKAKAVELQAQIDKRKAEDNETAKKPKVPPK